MPLHAYMARMSQPLSRPNAIANWLYAVASLVFLMVVVGGITRLTESGLSITEWKPVTGALPPLKLKERFSCLSKKVLRRTMS